MLRGSIFVMYLPRLTVLAAIVVVSFTVTGLVWFASKRSPADLSRYVPPAKATAINAGHTAVQGPTAAAPSPVTMSNKPAPAGNAVQAAVSR